jgi:hypothetical protein
MVEGCRFYGNYGILDKGLFLEEFGSIEDMAAIVNECGNSGIGTPDEKAVLFHGPQNTQIEMLPGGGRGPKPGVIADVHQDVGPMGDTFLGQVRKDGLVTDEHAQREVLLDQGLGRMSR